MALTDAKIRNTKPSDKPIKLTDAGGLYLEIRPNGNRFWRYRYRIAGKENVFALGEYPDMSLAEARKARDRARDLVRKGIHPAHQRQTERLVLTHANANTFEAIAREWIEKKEGGWTPYYLRQVNRFLASDVFPFIGHLPIKHVTAAHILELMNRAHARGASSVAKLIRQWSSAIFCYAVATLRADADPAAALKRAVPRKKAVHHKPLLLNQLIELNQAIDTYSGTRPIAIALKLLMLLFVRTAELRKACWHEFDFERSEWRIPAEKMKAGMAHIVPLSTQAMALLQELRHFTGNHELLFPNVRDPHKPISPTTLNRALERLGFNGEGTIDFSAHGFRATASTILNEAGYRPDIIERQLAHKERNQVRASYNQAEYLIERKRMMQDWADIIEQGNISTLTPTFLSVVA